MEEPSAAVKRAELRRAVHDLRERGLYQSAKWAAEQAVGLLPIDGSDSRSERRNASDAEP
eukprot:CAMPEP_0118937414 /NCGR_PEP_ID=MMETSP1169-20130426/22685_1 /TAXON_ID=36882 /ORGANISM="Pyramimonas obovata, Strain CCMP722" /LENGTH=59 /DNA_ID=CAMNT_0006881035 /DNA_START=87 /DNA_END=262 /DNA_ORIENTATION=+